MYILHKLLSLLHTSHAVCEYCPHVWQLCLSLHDNCLQPYKELFCYTALSNSSRWNASFSWWSPPPPAESMFTVTWNRIVIQTCKGLPLLKSRHPHGAVTCNCHDALPLPTTWLVYLYCAQGNWAKTASNYPCSFPVDRACYMYIYIIYYSSAIIIQHCMCFDRSIKYSSSYSYSYFRDLNLVASK